MLYRLVYDLVFGLAIELTIKLTIELAFLLYNPFHSYVFQLHLGGDFYAMPFVINYEIGPVANREDMLGRFQPYNGTGPLRESLSPAPMHQASCCESH